MYVGGPGVVWKEVVATVEVVDAPVAAAGSTVVWPKKPYIVTLARARGAEARRHVEARARSGMWTIVKRRALRGAVGTADGGVESGEGWSDAGAREGGKEKGAKVGGEK